MTAVQSSFSRIRSTSAADAGGSPWTLAAEVAAEEHPDPVELQLHEGRSEDVSGRTQGQVESRCDRLRVVVRRRSEERHRSAGVLLIEEWLRVLVLGVAVRAAVLRLLLLKMRRVEQDDLGESGRLLGAPDRSPVPVPHQHRQVSAVVEVGVGHLGYGSRLKPR